MESRKRLGFYIPSQSITILNSPSDFYKTLRFGINSAKYRISLASLYLGNGGKNQQLLNIMKQKAKDPLIDFSLLLDANRGTRKNKEGICSLSNLTSDILKNVYLFHSPFLSNVARVFPSRANEIFGTQHMKLYIFDDNIIITGANLSNDYFTNRQDRYWLISNAKELCDYYCELLDHIKRISYRVDFTTPTIKQYKLKYHLLEPDNCPSPKKNPLDYQWHGRDILKTFLEKSQRKYMNLYTKNSKNAFLVPSIQMGKFFINDDIYAMNDIFNSLRSNSNIYLATAYFNLDSTLSTKISKSNCNWNILTASPSANGFLGSRGFSGIIPYLYLNREYSFLKDLHRERKYNCNFYEWEKEGFTFHGKGLWLSNDNNNPYISVIGSSNFGYRSLELDFETQLTLTTSDTTLQESLKNERDILFNNGRKVDFSTFKKTSTFHKKTFKPWIRFGSSVLKRFL